MSATEAGPLGSAISLEVPDTPDASETVCHWLITAPSYHPLWSQYVLCVVRLREIPGMPSVHWHFQGATHEYLLVALDPENGPETPETMAGYAAQGGGLPFLVPVNISIQFEGTDEEMAEMARLGAWSVVNGYLNPETADAPDLVREQWKGSLVKTLAHIRGEEHSA